jgi:hypothetical protein
MIDADDYVRLILISDYTLILWVGMRAVVLSFGDHYDLGTIVLKRLNGVTNTGPL